GDPYSEFVVVQMPMRSGWNSGICDCCQDLNSCCYGFWCFPCFICSTTGEFGDSTCLPLLDIFVCVPPVSLGMRVAGSICEDIMVTCCCIWCSWCQMSREIKARKQTVTVLTTHPVIQPIQMATTTQVIATQQLVGVINVAPVAFAPAVQMASIPSVTTVVK
uniref:Uncharacterized protein n=1 Tax=Cyprinus carpio TaxID=7962 RepID=A0A8C1GPF7_CYPCA